MAASYLEQDCTKTLREGLAELSADYPEAYRVEPGTEAWEFFHWHDRVHVVFGCDTSLRNEIAADAWSVFGTTLSMRQFAGFFSIAEHGEIVAGVPWLSKLSIVAWGPAIVARVAWRSRRMHERWPWTDNDHHLDASLSELRARFGIRVLSLSR